MNKNIEAAYPLSPLQQGLLFHTVSRPGEPTYFEQICCTIRGSLDRAAFKQAWNWVVARHPILRTAFAYKQAQEPVQVVGRQVGLPLDWADWRDRSDPGADWQALLQADRAKGFDMAKAPLMRLTARQVGDDRHLFVWSHHHILLDGWSFGLVLDEVLTCYAALVRSGQPPALPAPRPFGDFIDYLGRRDQQADEGFWRDYLAGCGAPTRLAVDRGQGVHEGGGEAEVTLPVLLDPDVSRTIREQCGRLGVSLSALVHGAWARLLGAYSGEDQVMFGTTTAGRPPELRGVEQMVGLFINAVPLLVRIDPEARVGDWLVGLQRDLFKVQEHQYTGLSRIQELSPLRRGSPLFETLLSFQNYPLEDGHLRDWEGIQLDDYSWTGPTNYPIAVRAFPGERVMLVLTYYRHRLDDGVAAAMLDQLRSLVERLGSEPDRFLWEVGTVAGAHAERILDAWNATGQPYPDDQTLHGLAERQAALNPDALALVAGAERVTYAELEARANQLARHLREYGVRPGDRVGLCTEKSAATVIGMLAVMKAGAAYVPLDPAYPQARIAYMVEDARLKVLLTWGKGGTATQGLAVDRIALDADWERIAAQPPAPLALAVSPDAFAYVIYTSGSSGQPKGVMLNHRGRVNNVADYCRMFAIGPADRTLCVSSLSFDISVCDLFWTMHAGGTLVFPAPGRDKDPEHWLDLVEREGITLWHSAPALMDALLETAAERKAAGGAVPADLRLTVLDGDWIPLAMPDRVRAAFPAARVVSAGGATELSIDSVTYPVGAVDPAWRSIPYGKPMANQTAYIVDAHLQPVPVGVPGELLLGGIGVAAGYFERAALTADRFIPHPWPAVPGERLYRTGDLARFGPDGTIELIGRIDFQVKIRGVRIELGEIEATLRTHPLVAACLAGAPADIDGERRLAAYVVPAGPVDDTFGPTLRAWLRQRLPETLVPEAYVTLDSLPLSANGKVDRRALPTPQFAVAASGRAAPANALEAELARHWAGVLGIEPDQLDVAASFFDLGGNSLKALRACRLPGRPVPVTALYQHRSVRGVAAFLAERDAGAAAEALVPLTRAEAAPVALCVPYGGGHAGVYQGLAEALEGRMSVFAVRLPGHEHDGGSEALAPIDSVAGAVAQAAARFAGRPLVVYGHCGGVALATEITRRLEADKLAPRALVVAASYPPRDAAQLERDPFDGQSDEQLAMAFARLGGFDGLTPAEAQAIGRLLRHDGAEARRYFRAWLAGAGARLRTPLTCLIGEDDPLTADHAEGWTGWRRCAEHCTLSVLPGDHYFVRQHPQLVAARLLAAIETIENNELEVTA